MICLKNNSSLLHFIMNPSQNQCENYSQDQWGDQCENQSQNYSQNQWGDHYENPSQNQWGDHCENQSQNHYENYSQNQWGDHYENYSQNHWVDHSGDHQKKNEQNQPHYYTMWIKQPNGRNEKLALDYRVYGHYECSHCQQYWPSTYAWVTNCDWRKCTYCNSKTLQLPFELEKIEPNPFPIKETLVWTPQLVGPGDPEPKEAYKEHVIGHYRCNQCNSQWKDDHCMVYVHWRQYCIRPECENKLWRLPDPWSVLIRSRNPSKWKKPHPKSFCEKCRYFNDFCVHWNKVYKIDVDENDNENDNDDGFFDNGNGNRNEKVQNKNNQYNQNIKKRKQRYKMYWRKKNKETINK